jgi:tetratricopeptide (TPR) repeat protein
MGNIYHDQAKEYDKAIELYQKALDVYDRLPTYSKKGFYTSLGNLGMAYSSTEMYSKAIDVSTKL